MRELHASCADQDPGGGILAMVSSRMPTSSVKRTRLRWVQRVGLGLAAIGILLIAL